MSVARAREVRDRLRVLGFTVHEWAGWESRGNGQSSAYEGGVWHHTASGYGSAPSILVYGRADLSGPLCNFAGNADGSFTLIAAHPANHAGASGGYGTAPLPRTSLFNRYVMGLEIVYPGDKPMTLAQYRAMCAWGRVCADVFGFGDLNRIKGHKETSITGKWDPGYAPGRTINLSQARADARGITARKGFLMALTDDEQSELLGKVRGLYEDAGNTWLSTGKTVTQGRAIADMYAAVKWMSATLGNTPDLNKDGKAGDVPLVEYRQALVDLLRSIDARLAGAK